MGVSMPQGGGGHGRSLNADLNLVPFIDLLSTLITFLLATAVWTQTSAMLVDQNIADPNTPPPENVDPPTPPMTIHVRSDGVWLGRKIEEGKNFPKEGEDYDWVGVGKMLEEDHTALPDETQVVIVTDDGVFYEHMVKALDMSRTYGYDKTLLGGGPATQNAGISTPPPGGAPPK